MSAEAPPRPVAEPAPLRAQAPAATPVHYDLLVVGGGIFGAGVAREAALHGWRTLLVERGDLGEGTSSRSSKLIHGGLRYLEQARIRMVRESLRERLVLADLAPHLAWPLPFLVPVHAGGRLGRLRLRLGLWLYDRLARAPTAYASRMLSASELSSRAPALRTGGLLGGGCYFDWQTLDSRLVLECALAAEESGARILTRTEASAAEGDPSVGYTVALRDLAGGTTWTAQARSLALTVGPWTGAWSRLGGGSGPPARLVSGVHVVVPEISADAAWLLTSALDGRVFFVLPFFGRTLIGTTDRDTDSPEPPLEARDLDYLLESTNAALGDRRLAREDVISAFQGVRVLAGGRKTRPSRATRDEEIRVLANGAVAVAGGKLTTWRLTAHRILERLARSAGLPLDDGTRSRRTPLPGGCFGRHSDRAATVAALAAEGGIDPSAAGALLQRYGSRAAGIARLLREDPRLRRPVSPRIPETAGEYLWLVRHEHARSLEDVLRRRTPRRLTDRLARSDLEAAACLLGAELAWDPERRALEVARVQAASQLPDGFLSPP
jgi:glycerol-3-phosphate dehydrogenase